MSPTDPKLRRLGRPTRTAAVDPKRTLAVYSPNGRDWPEGDRPLLERQRREAAYRLAAVEDAAIRTARLENGVRFRRLGFSEYEAVGYRKTVNPENDLAEHLKIKLIFII